MENRTLNEIVKAWRSFMAPYMTVASPIVRVQDGILHTLAEGRPASPEEVAEATGVPLDDVTNIFTQLRAGGSEFDHRGNIVGMALTLNPTPHRFRIDGRKLYAWCSLDTLFLPALVGRTAEVESSCPVTGEEVRLTVSADGVEGVQPARAMLSIVAPGVTPSCGPGAPGGPQGPFCSNMHFFSSSEAASTWLAQHPGAAVLTVAEAYELALEVWIRPYRRLSEAR